MADFAAALTPEATGFADGEGREVVVQDEAFAIGTAGVGVDLLGFVERSEGSQADSLGFAASEERGAVGAGKNADFAGEGAHLVGRASIAAFIFVEDAGAESFFLEVIKGLGDFERSGSGKFFENLGFDLILKTFDGFIAIDLGGLIDGGLDPGAGHTVGDLEEFVFDEEEGGLAFLFSVGSGQLFLNFNDGLDGLLGEFKSGFELSLG